LSKLAEARRFAVRREGDAEDDIGVSGKDGEQFPVRDLVEAQVSLGGRLAAGHCQQAAIRAEAQVIDGAEDVGQKLHRPGRCQVPDRDAPITAGRQELAVRTETDRGHRGERTYREAQGKFRGVCRAEQTLGRNRIRVQRNFYLARSTG
jgi:hypothetical protein